LDFGVRKVNWKKDVEEVTDTALLDKLSIDNLMKYKSFQPV